MLLMADWISWRCFAIGQFEDRVYAILMHTPSGAKLIPLADNTGLDPPLLAPPTQVTMDDDDDDHESL